MLDEPPQFSEAFKQTKGRLSISPSGRLVAVVVQYRLTIRDVESLRTVQVFSHDDEVSHVEWSADSLYVLCVLPHRGLCHVWAVDDAEWYCKIDEGPLGVAHARWAPDGRHVLSSSDFGMRLTVWSLLDRSVRYIRAPKFPAAAVAFSAEGGWLAVAERREGVDALGVYECGSFERVAHFALATADVADVCWAPAAAGLVGGGTRGAGAADTSSPDWLLVTDGPLQLALFVYRRDGQLISRLAANSTRPARALGARLSAWAPAGRVVAFGSYDGEVRVLVSRTCHCIAQLLHPRTLRATHADDDRRDPLVFREELLAADQRADGAAHGAAETMVRADSAAMQLQELAESLPHVDTLTRPTHFVPASAAEQPIHLPRRAAAALRDEPLPKIGVDVLAWSPDGRYLATHVEEMPAVLWVWEAVSLRLHTVVIARAPVLCARWHPLGEVLAFCTASCQLYLWSSEGMSVLALPDELRLRVHRLRWAPDGRSLALTDAERFCWCYLPSQPDERSSAPARTAAHAPVPSGQEQQDPNLSDKHTLRRAALASAAAPGTRAGDAFRYDRLSLAQQQALAI